MNRRRIGRLVISLVVAGLLVMGLEAGGTPTTATSQVLDSGIYGQTLAGPTTPVCQPRIPCEAPFSTTVIVRLPNSQAEVARFTSDRYGLFLLKLPPGRYRLVPLHPNTLPAMQPRGVTVVAHEFTRVVLRFNTGIR